MSKLYDLLNTLIGKVNKSVKTEAQTLTDAQKAQVRENIGAAGADDVGGGGVQSDWNQMDETAADFIKNKPFGEIKDDTLTWDIKLGDIDFDSIPGGGWVKVSDTIVTMDDLANGFIIDLFGEQMHFYAEDCASFDGLIMGPDALFFFVDESAVGIDFEGMIFPESGVYVVVDVPNGCLTIPNFTKFIALKKMSDRYLPDTCTDQVVIYLSQGQPYLYKDSGFVERYTYEELLDFSLAGTRVVLSEGVHMYEAISINCTGEHATVVYTIYNYADKQPELRVAYTAEYTG